VFLDMSFGLDYSWLIACLPVFSYSYLFMSVSSFLFLFAFVLIFILSMMLFGQGAIQFYVGCLNRCSIFSPNLSLLHR